MKRPFAVTLAGAALTAVTVSGCASSFHHAASTAATESASAAPQAPTHQLCSEQAAWNQRGAAFVKALYADTGALAADASANNQPAVTSAGRKLTSDAIAAATLPLPPIDTGSWKSLTADYAAAGTAIAGGNASGAIPKLQAGNSAIAAFSSAIGKCATAKP